MAVHQLSVMKTQNIRIYIKYGQKVKPLFWIKLQNLVDWKGLFQQNFKNQTHNLQLSAD